MRRFPSGTVDQVIYFVAVDSSDLITRETGLSSFTVYRARNGAAAAAYTTPTIAEVSSANMPGVYSLLLDEDMTIGSGNKSEEVVLHITQASMAPVTLIFELYRPDVTDAETITVSSGAVSTVAAVTTVNGLAAGVVTASAIATGAIDADSLAADAGTEIAAAVWDRATTSLTVAGSAGKLLVDNLDTTVSSRASQTSLDTVDDLLDTEVAAIKSVVDAILVDTAEIGAAGAGLTALATQASVTTIDDFLDTEIAAIKAKTDLIPAAPAAVGDIPTAAAVADAVWDEDATAHQTQGTFGQAIGDPAADTDSIWALVNTNLDAAVSTRLASASYTAPLDAAGTRTAVGLASANLDTQLADLPTNAELATALGTADDAVLAQVALVKAKTDLIPAAPAAVGDIPTADITAIKAKTDSLTFTVAGQADVNLKSVTGVTVTGTGSDADPWGP